MTDPEKSSASDYIRRRAIELGFDLVGIAPSGTLSENARILREWCESGMNAGMNYLSSNIEKRSDPTLLFPGTKSIIVTGLNYYTEKVQGGNGVPVISRYAYGADYHVFIIDRLNMLIEEIKNVCPGSDGKAYVDSASIFEKGWAVKAGLGWQGKNSLLINRIAGSFIFLGIILVDIELDYDDPSDGDHCGSCSLCIDQCPTGAINHNKTINAGKCISYLTIESRDPVKKEAIQSLEGRLFGCDKCQEVCPWNKNAKPHKVNQFEISHEVLCMTPEDWRNLTREDHRRLFSRSAIGRRKYKIFIENVTNVTDSINDF